MADLRSTLHTRIESFELGSPAKFTDLTILGHNQNRVHQPTLAKTGFNQTRSNFSNRVSRLDDRVTAQRGDQHHAIQIGTGPNPWHSFQSTFNWKDSFAQRAIQERPCFSLHWNKGSFTSFNRENFLSVVQQELSLPVSRLTTEIIVDTGNNRSERICLVLSGSRQILAPRHLNAQRVKDMAIRTWSESKPLSRRMIQGTTA